MHQETFPRTWFRRVWNELDTNAIDELFAADGVAHGIYGEVILGPAGFRAFHAAFCAQFSDIHIDVVDEFATGERIAIRCTGRMVHRATGKPARLEGMCMARVTNGKMVEAWNYWDFLGVLETMRLLPAGSFGMALQGHLKALTP